MFARTWGEDLRWKFQHDVNPMFLKKQEEEKKSKTVNLKELFQDIALCKASGDVIKELSKGS